MELTKELETRLKRAFERRFGQSCLPLNITFRETWRGIWRVTDDETGTWAEYTERRVRKGRFSMQDRLVRLREFDAAAADDRMNKRIADRVDGYDRDDLGESPDY